MSALFISYFKSIIVLSLLFTLMAYHIFIFLGRKEYYYLEFSLFIFCLIVFILTCIDLRFEFIASREIDNTYGTVINSIAFAGLMHFIKNVYRNLFSFPEKWRKLFLPMYICTLGVVLISFTTFFAFDFFTKYLIAVNLILATIASYSMLGIYIFWLIRSKTFLTNYNLLIVITWILAWVEMTVEVVPYVLHFHYPFKDTYLFTGISVFTWSFIMADKFNKEHFELKVLRDKLEEKIVERTKELQVAIETRTNTFINLAHEIKTPLTLINSYLDKCISMYGLTFEMNIIKDNVDKMVRDIGNSFTEEKFRKGIVPEDHNYILNLSRTLTDKSIIFNEIALRNKVSLKVKIEDNIYIKAHPNAVDSIINNLVENAIKYVPENGTISLILFSENDKTIFIVKDNGYGIPEDLHKKIFEPGYQISGKKQNYQGIGMGLYIVKMMVESIGGRIDLNSKLNEGTEFIIELAQYKLLPQDIITQYAIHGPLNIQLVNNAKDILNDQIKHSILIVEDNSQLLQYLADELKQNFNIYVAMNGREAVDRLKNIPRPDLILSDVMMDNMDGFEFLEIISKDTNLKSIPLIFITARSAEHEKLSGLHLGAVDYIYKPFKIEEIVSKAISIVTKSDQNKRYLVSSITEFLESKFELGHKPPESKENKFDQNCYLFNISSREKDIVKLLSEGLTYKLIATRLFISENTVSKHVQNLYEKTGVKNRTDLLGKLFG
jgi:DNA-binding NarL/FixJ family response regulator/signal transduction histidine kinase